MSAVRMGRTTCLLLLLSATCSAAVLARQPPRDYDTVLTTSARDFAAELLVEQSTVIADGVIEWSPSAWRAWQSHDFKALERLPARSTFPRLRPTRVLKGAKRPFYLIGMNDEGDPNGLFDLAPGTKVRLLMVPVPSKIGGLAYWEVSDTSRSNSRDHERSINKAIDKLLGSKRASETSLIKPPIEERAPVPAMAAGKQKVH